MSGPQFLNNVMQSPRKTMAVLGSLTLFAHTGQQINTTSLYSDYTLKDPLILITTTGH